MKVRTLNMENAIKINRAITTVTVNEAGDTITIDLDDQEFISRLVETMGKFETEAKELQAAHGENTDLKAVASASIDLCRHWKTALDELLGEGTCEKVFGNITPSVAAFADFFDQFGDILRREQGNVLTFQSEKVKKYIEKYAKYHQKEAE